MDAETGKPAVEGTEWTIIPTWHRRHRPLTTKRRAVCSRGVIRENWSGGSPHPECCTFRGSLTALDADTGQKVWKSYSVPDPPKAYKKNSVGTQLYGPAGAGIWNSPTIDEKRQRVYVNTGNSFTGISIPTSDSLLAFDLATGSLLWSVQATPHDNWMVGCPKGPNCPDDPGDDLDFGSASVLRTLPGGKQVLVAAPKAGVVYGFDPGSTRQNPVADPRRRRRSAGVAFSGAAR